MPDVGKAASAKRLASAGSLGSYAIQLFQNCSKTCFCVLGGYFEREADSLKVLKSLKAWWKK
jgi:hypothetical protein